jgi:lambda family phage portal protein
MPFHEYIDSAIFSMFPAWGARRKAIRRQFEQFESFADRAFGDEPDRSNVQLRAFEGAEHDRLRGDSWLVSQLSPNSALEWDLKTLRDRSNDLYRASPYGTGAIESQVTEIVGGTLIPKCRIPKFEPLTTREQAKRWKQQLEWLFYRWAPFAGTDEECFLAQIRLAVRCWKRDGDCLVVLRRVGAADKPIPLAIEVIEAEQVETPPKELDNPNIRLGVERDPTHKRVVAYHVRVSPPGDTREVELRWVRIPVYDANGRKQACLLFEKLYPGQVRGLPAMFSAMNLVRDIHDIERFRRVGQAAAACFVAFIKTVGASPEEAAEGAATEKRRGKRIEQLFPGMIQRLAEGEEVQFGQPNFQGGDVAQWLQTQLKALACATNRTYTSVARDWERFTMSGGRLELIQARRVARADQAILDSTVLYHVWRRLVTEAVLTEELDVDPYFFRTNEWLFIQHGWVFSGMEWLDPKGDISADGLAVESKFKTRHEVIAGRGGDFDEILDELEEEEQDIRDRGMDPTIPMMNRGATGEADNNQTNPADKQAATANA